MTDEQKAKVQKIRDNLLKGIEHLTDSLGYEYDDRKIEGADKLLSVEARLHDLELADE